jgi:hypothetical protein
VLQTLILSTVVCLAIAAGVWLILKKSRVTGQAGSRPIGRQVGNAEERRSMELGDWGSAAFNVVLGVVLGVLINNLAKLLTTTLWPLAAAIPIFFAGVFFIEWVSDRLLDRLFPSGIRPASPPRPKRRKPLPRLLSLPVGVGIGIALAQLGFGDQILGLLP